MVKMLTKHGNSLALVLDKPVLELLHIAADTPLEISTNGEQLIISPIHKKRRIRESLKKMDRRYGTMMKHLAE